MAQVVNVWWSHDHIPTDTFTHGAVFGQDSHDLLLTDGLPLEERNGTGCECVGGVTTYRL
jgi:hypothetical protein